LEKHLPVLVGKVAVTGIVHKYEVGETTHRIGNHYGISKTRVAIVLRKQGITMRRQGLTDDQVDEAVGLYSTGKSLAWISSRYNVSDTTVAAALRWRGVQLRPRRGWR
jgi:hypothetical protein